MSSKKKWIALLEAAETNDAGKVAAMVADLKLDGEEKYYAACVKAIEGGADRALAALLKAGGGYNFCSIFDGLEDRIFRSHDRDAETTKNIELARQLIEKAYAAPAAEALLLVLYANRGNVTRSNITNSYGNVPIESFLNKEAPISLLEKCLAGSGFNACVNRVGLYSTEKLDYILTVSLSRGTGTLNRALYTVADWGDREKAALLLKYRADANYDDAGALRCAAENADREMISLLLPHTSLDSFGAKLVAQLKHKKADPAIIQTIEDAAKKAVRETQPEATAVPAQSDRFQRLDDDMLLETRHLPDGSTLTTLFNFSSRQQEKMTKDEAGNISHAKPVNFSDLDDGVVDEMRARLDALAEPAPQLPAAANDGYRKFRSAI